MLGYYCKSEMTNQTNREDRMTNESIKLANLWMSLGEIKNQFDNEIIPISSHLGIEDPDLMIAMEELSDKIGNHFNRFRLIAETKRGGNK